MWAIVTTGKRRAGRPSESGSMGLTVREGAARPLPPRRSSLPRPLVLAIVTRPKPGRSGSDEVKRVVEEAYDEAIRLRSRLDGLAEALLRDETLDQPQAYAAAGRAPPPEDEAAPVEAAAPVAT
jgi:cell division protease FtsH